MKQKIELTPYEIRAKKCKRDDSQLLTTLAIVLFLLWASLFTLFINKDFPFLNNQIQIILKFVLFVMVATLFILVFRDAKKTLITKRRFFESSISEENLKRDKRIILIAYSETLVEPLIENRLMHLRVIQDGLSKFIDNDAYKIVFVPKLTMFQSYFVDESIGIYDMIEINDCYNTEKRKKN